MSDSSTAAAAAPENAPRRGPLARLGDWFGQERVFRWIPFVLVEATFLLVIIIPFVLTVYISFLRWRANRPFEQAELSGFRNYEQVLTDPGFWASLGRTFYFAGTAVHTNFLCNLGYGDVASLPAKPPRLSFAQAARIV